MQDQLQESRFMVLAEAVTSAHKRLFPEEPTDPRTLQVIALALSELIPIYLQGSQRALTEPELAEQGFSEPAMERLLVSRRRLEAALETFLVASLEQARASLILRQSPRGATDAR